MWSVPSAISHHIRNALNVAPFSVRRYPRARICRSPITTGNYIVTDVDSFKYYSRSTALGGIIFRSPIPTDTFMASTGVNRVACSRHCWLYVRIRIQYIFISRQLIRSTFNEVSSRPILRRTVVYVHLFPYNKSPYQRMSCLPLARPPACSC